MQLKPFHGPKGPGRSSRVPVLRDAWRGTRPSAQRGQALTEFCVAAAFVLVPLFLMMPLLGKYMDMKASTIQAARYAGWERTVWYGSSDWEAGGKSDAEIATEVQKRFFSDSSSAAADGGLKNTDRTAGTSTGGKALWQDHAGVPMLETYTVTNAAYPTPGTVNGYVDTVRSAVNFVADFLGANFKLDMTSLYKSTATLDTANTSAIQLVTGGASTGFEAPKFSMHHVLVANGWSANGPEFVKKQSNALAPLSALSNPDAPSAIRELKTGLDKLQPIAGTFATELSSSSLKFGGELKPDAVPKDRLVAGAATTPPPTPRPRQTQADRDAVVKAEDDAVRAKAKQLEERIKKLVEDTDRLSNKVVSCKAAKMAEYNRNHVVDTVFNESCYQTYVWGRVNTCGNATASNSKQVLRLPPGGAGTSYTPNADADVNCHSGLDQKIAALQAQFDSPRIQQPILDSNKKLADNSDLNVDVPFMNSRRDAFANISMLQSSIDILKLDKAIQDRDAPLDGNPVLVEPAVLAALAAERQALVDKRQRLIGLRNAVQVFDDELATKLAASVANKQPYQPTAKFIADRKAAREALAVFQDRPSE